MTEISTNWKKAVRTGMLRSTARKNIAKLIRKLDDEIRRLQMQRLRFERDLATLTSPYWVGDRVLAGGHTFEVTRIGPCYSGLHKYRIWGRRVLKTGKLGVAEAEITGWVTGKA